jgi:hypothetical protein
MIVWRLAVGGWRAGGTEDRRSNKTSSFCSPVQQGVIGAHTGNIANNG